MKQVRHASVRHLGDLHCIPSAHKRQQLKPQEICSFSLFSQEESENTFDCSAAVTPAEVSLSHQTGHLQHMSWTLLPFQLVHC